MHIHIFYADESKAAFLKSTFPDYPYGEKNRLAIDLLIEIRKRYPEARVPYISLLRTEFMSCNVAGDGEVFFLRNDSESGVGGIQGLLTAFYNDANHNPNHHDPMLSSGFAALINEEWNRPDSLFSHLRPASFIVSFMGRIPLLSNAIPILINQYHHLVTEEWI